MGVNRGDFLWVGEMGGLGGGWRFCSFVVVVVQGGKLVQSWSKVPNISPYEKYWKVHLIKNVYFLATEATRPLSSKDQIYFLAKKSYIFHLNLSVCGGQVKLCEIHS